MPADDIAISVRNLTKTYRLFGHPGDRVKQFFSLGFKQYHREFTALKDVSFDIKKGETVGIIGRNGSGKSTLLQLICGILKPTSGSVHVNGRISALLELGAGFNPEFTGRENVYFQGALMGFTQAQMDERFDQIAAFADIGDFIDQPVRTYSSGMFVRLAFAVAVHVDPDILVIDEVLAVGDATFQKRCFDRIYHLQSIGVTILVVSHNPYHIERLCDRAAAMHGGNLASLGPAKDILASYHEMMQRDLPPLPAVEAVQRDGTGELRFTSVRLESAEGDNKAATSSLVRVVAQLQAEQPIENVRFRFEIFSANNELVTVITSNGLSETVMFAGAQCISFTIDPCQLTSGWYYLDAIAGGRHARLDTWPRAAEFNVLMRDRDTQNLSTDRGVFVCHGSWQLS
jgi:ABC-type polysaccharide/polyol phosphate transport system ATPase subunit